MKFLLALTASLWASMALPNQYEVRVERFVDADTFAGEISVGFRLLLIDQRFRLYCINAPESRGSRKTQAGVAIAGMVKALGIRSGTIEVVKQDAFGRWLVWFTPYGWDQTLNEWLSDHGAPLYDRLTRVERAICESRL